MKYTIKDFLKLNPSINELNYFKKHIKSEKLGDVLETIQVHNYGLVLRIVNSLSNVDQRRKILTHVVGLIKNAEFDYKIENRQTVFLLYYLSLFTDRNKILEYILEEIENNN